MVQLGSLFHSFLIRASSSTLPISFKSIPLNLAHMSGHMLVLFLLICHSSARVEPLLHVDDNLNIELDWQETLVSYVVVKDSSEEAYG